MASTNEYWATQSPVTEPGDAAPYIDKLASELVALRQASSQLMFHYRAGDFSKHKVPVERKREINLRYADALLDVILSRGERDLGRTRKPIDRVVGCCRDATVMFLALARHKGIPARGRVGFASYLVPGWFLDHVVAEIWDEAEKRWRLVDPQMEASFKPKVHGVTVNWLDLADDEFITGPRAWRAARAGRSDPSRYVVSPNVDLPFLRGWPYLAHNVLHDLASLSKKEMLLWDEWGVQESIDEKPIKADTLELLDEISAATSDADLSPDWVQEMMSRDGLKVPSTIQMADPMGGPMMTVDVGRIVKEEERHCKAFAKVARRWKST